MRALPVRLFCVLMLLGSAAASAVDTYTFGVVPQQSANTLASTWVPLLNALGSRAGLAINFRTAPTIPEFERRLAAGEYDFAYMNPYHYTVFSRNPGYRAFAKAKDTLIKCIIVVSTDSTIRDPRELAGAELAFPAPASFAASVLTRAFLTKQGIAFTPKYVASHDSVYKGVAAGLYPGGGGVVQTLHSVDPDLRERLRILWTTEGFTPHAFAAHPRVPAPVVQRLTAAMTAIDQNDQDKALLTALSFKGFVAGQDRDWDDVRGLGIDLLERLSQPVQ
jgi:phosphonate transport system substrate-binding protein